MVRFYDPETIPTELADAQYRAFDLRAAAPIQISSLFLSYAHADREFVDALGDSLNRKGIRFWRDVHHATSGPLDKIVARAIRLNPTVLLVLSRNSVESDWVEHEAAQARELEKELKRHVLCPVALDDAWKDCGWSHALQRQIRKYNVLPFHEWRDARRLQEMFVRLVDGLSIFYQKGR